MQVSSFKFQVSILALAACALTGCSTIESWWGDAQPIISTNLDQIIGVTTQALEQLREPQPRRAIVVGLTKVDADAYGGWSGECPGTDIDADVFADLCKKQGIEVTQLDNKKATILRFEKACLDAVVDMTNGGLLVLFYSGHGGQVADENSDEEDGADETLCLYDGQLTDDTLSELWQKLPPDVRVFFVTDSCNAGTNFRAPLSARAFVPRAYRGELIHFGGCADGKSSYGSDTGGTFTSALMKAWKAGSSYKDWFRRAAAKMPLEQLPAYAEYGDVSDAFRNGPALQ